MEDEDNNDILAFCSIFEVFVISCVGSIVAPGHGGARVLRWQDYSGRWL